MLRPLAAPYSRGRYAFCIVCEEGNDLHDCGRAWLERRGRAEPGKREHLGLCIVSRGERSFAAGFSDDRGLVRLQGLLEKEAFSCGAAHFGIALAFRTRDAGSPHQIVPDASLTVTRCGSRQSSKLVRQLPRRVAGRFRTSQRRSSPLRTAALPTRSGAALCRPDAFRRGLTPCGRRNLWPLTLFRGIMHVAFLVPKFTPDTI